MKKRRERRNKSRWREERNEVADDYEIIAMQKIEEKSKRSLYRLEGGGGIAKRKKKKRKHKILKGKEKITRRFFFHFLTLFSKNRIAKIHIRVHWGQYRSLLPWVNNIDIYANSVVHSSLITTELKGKFVNVITRESEINWIVFINERYICVGRRLSNVSAKRDFVH